jgi:hypothetical protein
MDQNDGRQVSEEVKFTKQQERLVIYARRLYSTLGAQAFDALMEPFGMKALLKDKCSMELEQDKAEEKVSHQELNPIDEFLSKVIGEEKQQQAGHCQCEMCKRTGAAKDVPFRAAYAMLNSDAEQDLTDLYMNSPHFRGPELLMRYFARGIALGYVLGRDERKVISGKYDDDLDQLDRLNAIAELDKELSVSESMMQVKGSGIMEMAAVAFEERRDIIKMMRKYIDSKIIPVKEIRDICSLTQHEYIASQILPFIETFNLIDMMEQRLLEKEAEIKRLKSALE